MLHTETENDNCNNQEGKGRVIKLQRKSKANNEKICVKKIGTSHNLSIIILKANGINSPIIIHRLAEGIIRQDLSICYL